MKVVKPYSQVRIRMAVRSLLRLFGYKKVKGLDGLAIGDSGDYEVWVRANGRVYLGYRLGGCTEVHWNERYLSDLVDNLACAVDNWRDRIHTANDQTGKFNQMVQFVETVVGAKLNADRLKVLCDWIKQTEGGDKYVR